MEQSYCLMMCKWYRIQNACFVLQVCSASMILHNLPNVSKLHRGNVDGWGGEFPSSKRGQANDYIMSTYD